VSSLGGLWPALLLAWRAAPGRLAGHLAGTLVAAVLPAANVWLLQSTVDAIVVPAERSGLAASAVGLVVSGLATSAMPSVTGYLRAELGRRIARRAQSDLYLATARQVGLARLENPEFHDRLRMATQSGRTSPGDVVDGTIGVAQTALTVASLVAVLAAISPLVAAVAVLGLVPALVAEALLSRARVRMMHGLTPTERRELFYADLQTNLAAAKELRLFGLFDLFRTRMIDELSRADRQKRRMDAREMRAQLGLGLLSAAVLGGGLVWAVTAAGRGELGVGAVSAFIVAVTALQGGLTALVHQVAMMYRALLMYEHYRVVLATPPDLPLAATPTPVPVLRRGIELRDVWFRYGPDQPWVLRGVSLNLPYGRATALVGLNGAGKSTLVKLLCRLYDPTRGSIRWDGVDLRELPVAQLRDRIGAVFQDYVSYDLSAAENVGLGDVRSLDDRTRVRDAAARAGVGEVLDALPGGYDTMLSREYFDGDTADGVLLSGGQWQRVALARALFALDHGSSIVVLDEPTASLDVRAEARFFDQFSELARGATTLLISHRFSTVRHADKIVVLDGGRVSEQGTHDELMALDGRYAELFRLQAERFSQAGAPEPDEVLL
jgi:ATP-binding cassette, subfamily B, bacterial